MSQLKDKSQYTKLQTCHVQKILEFSGILLLLRPWKNTMRKLQDMKMKCCTRLETIKKSNYVSINSFYDTGGGTHNSTSIGKNNHFSHNKFPTWLLQVRDHRSDHAKKNCPIFSIGVRIWFSVLLLLFPLLFLEDNNELGTPLIFTVQQSKAADVCASSTAYHL